MIFILLIVGFILLVKGADYFVEGSSNFAKYLRVPTLIIGLTVVSLGTSAPEIIVSLIASIRNSNDIAISNAIGSNMFNLLVVLGACATVKTLTTKRQIITRDYVISIVVTIMLLIFMFDKFLNPDQINIISRSEGLILILAFVLYSYSMIMLSKRERIIIKEYHNLTTVDILMLFSGLLAVILGGELVVRSAKEIAIYLGISETLVGLTIVSIGTSLPELITSLVAAKKGEVDIAIGNVIGSNIYNVLLVIGLSSAINTLKVSSYGIVDTFILLIVSIVCYIFLLRKNKINKSKGILMLLIYLLFIIYIICR